MGTNVETKDGMYLVECILGLVVDIDDIRLAKAYECITRNPCKRVGNNTFEITFNVEEKSV